MKRVLSLLLTAVLLSVLCLPARADGEEEISRRVSEYCEAASMSDYRELFRDAESGGMGRDMTRAMLAGILYNIFGSAEDAETIPSDVDASQWYAAGTAWALKKNIIPNDGNGTFSPDMPITREAFLITLYRCANAYGVSFPAINAWYSFLDGGLMTPEAQTAAFTIQRAGVTSCAFRQKLPRVFARHADQYAFPARKCQRGLLAAFGRAAEDDRFHRHSLSIHSGCDRKCRCANPAVVFPLCIPPGQHNSGRLALRISKSYAASPAASVAAW